MMITTGKIVSLKTSKTQKGNARVDLSLETAEGAMNCTTFGTNAEAIAQMEEGATLTVAISPSNGRYATEKGDYLISEIDPVMPTREICYDGRTVEAGEIIVLTAPELLGVYEVLKPLTPEVLREMADFGDEQHEDTLDERLVMEGYITPLPAAEMNLSVKTRAGIRFDMVMLDDLAVAVPAEDGEAATEDEAAVAA